MSEARRQQRIQSLLAYAKEKHVSEYSKLLRAALHQYPYISEKTVRSYAITVRRILNQEEQSRQEQLELN